MNAVVRLDKPLLHLVAESYACAWCWPRISLTRMRDRDERPMCAACQDNPNRKRAMPKFVIRSINEARHDY